MAESIVQKVEREFVIPIRRDILNAPRYDRTNKAILRIREFIAKHMHVKNRLLENVKFDVHFNNFLWLKGRKNPPAKVKVKAVKDGDNVIVSFAEIPKEVEFRKAKFAKLHKSADSPKVEEHKHDDHEGHDHAGHTHEEKVEAKTEEKEKEKAVSEANQKEIKQEVRAQKHVTKVEKVQHPQRMALQK